MTLSVLVGLLSHLKKSGQDQNTNIDQSFSDLNKVLSEHNIPTHMEPDHIDEEKHFGMNMHYTALHKLRRVAAWVAVNGKLPDPCEEYKNDMTVITYYDKAAREILPFQHLVDHSDCDGFYLPYDFERPLTFSANHQYVAFSTGSSQKLKEECEQLAEKMGFDLTMDVYTDEMKNALSGEDRTGAFWKKYAIECFVCHQLHQAAIRSIESGSAVVLMRGES